MSARASAVSVGTSDRPVLRDVVREHLEEVAFLSIQRRKLLFSPKATISQFDGHRERIAAHWDGLVVAGPASVELAVESLEELDPWEVHAAARVWLELGAPSVEAVVEKIAGADEELLAAWREALRALRPETLTRVLPDSLLTEGPPPVQSTLAYGRGWHGTLPPACVPELVASEDASVRRSLARAIGWSDADAQGAKALARILADDSDAEVRRAALWSGFLVNPEAAVASCRQRVSAGDPDAFEIRVLGLVGEAGDVKALMRLLESEGLGIAAIRALGDLGCGVAVPKIRAALEDEDEPTAEAAREALRALLGNGADEAGAEIPGGRHLRGQPFPWAAEPEEEPMESLWRTSLVAPAADTAWLRREVPDGFFTAEPEPTAVPGV